MSNRLARQSSPYLLQHQHNPVDWFPWGEEALHKAKTENKPIFLSIGYAACHWCHVMAHESFEDEETAELMNRLFINIKVDREERPDLDGIYMQAVVALTGHGGWPMSVFLTPGGQPFYGGTYFPPVPRYQMPSFRQVLIAIAQAWEKDQENVRSQAVRLSSHLQQELGGLPPSQTQGFTAEDLRSISRNLNSAYDWKNGGWGKAPKFPQPMTVEFLLRQAARGNRDALKMAVHALDAMAQGGMYDVVGGGFARYSVDDNWLVPHFEKMLYDNAQLARIYLSAWLLTGKARYRSVVEETLDFVMREMTGPEGGFFASLDADSEGEEGKFYVWTKDEIRAALPDEPAFSLVCTAYGIEGAGNFEGKFVLQRQQSDKELASKTGIRPEEVPLQLSRAHKLLLKARSARIRPGTDDKCVTAWNGLMLCVFSEAGKAFNNKHYLGMAMRNAIFLRDFAVQTGTGRLLRTWRAGQPGPIGYLEDYAAAALGYLALYQASPEPEWFRIAHALTNRMIELFHVSETGFFDTGSDHETLIIRPRDLQDNATPSGSSLATRLLILMHAFTGEGNYRDLAEATLSPILEPGKQYPTAFANWLCAADLAVGPVQEIVLVGDRIAGFEEVLWGNYRPRMVVAAVQKPDEPGLPPLARRRNLVDGKSTAFVCEGFVCRQPTTDPEVFKNQLND